MGSTKKTTTNTSSMPQFGAQGQGILNNLEALFNQNPQSTDYGQFFLDALSGKGFGRGQLDDEISLITQKSDAALPRELANARSFTRNRPDTFSNQVNSNVVADNMIGRDLSIAQLLREQGNIDRGYQGQAASALAGMDANRMSQGTSLLSLLRGEKSTQTSKSKSFSPLSALATVGGLIAAPFTGGASLGLTAGAAGGGGGKG